VTGRTHGHFWKLFERLPPAVQQLAREKAAMNRIWAKREKQIETIVSSTAKFTGELQALCGPSLEQLPQFQLPGSELTSAARSQGQIGLIAE
jgi:hypothetical protein